MSNQKKLPLEGIKVLDIGTLFAGPWVATYMADFGAEVIKVEHPKGDSIRNFAPHKDGVSLWWKLAGRGKKSLTCDLSKPAGQEILKKLCTDADVLVENFRPGTIEKWGLGWSALHEINPKLILARTSGFGQEGPYAKRPGFGTLAEAMSGFAHITGSPDGPPTLPAFALADGISAMCSTYGVMMALYHRDMHDALGQEIDTAIYEPMTTILGPQSLMYDHMGTIQTRTGNSIPFVAPRNTYRCKDGRYVVLSASAESIFKRIMQAIGRDDLAVDPRMQTQEGRVTHTAELDNAIQEWIGAHTLNDTVTHFQEFEGALGPVYDIEQLLEDPHVQHRGTFVELEDEELGSVRIQGPIPNLKETPGKIRWPGPPKGKHTDEILKTLNYTDNEITQLREASVI
ncbi:MAG: CoA transferase [Nitrospinaceae bacterium]|jgi:crotonobetainyl-CoA:carnitine CoA-transferase CaiB-like acyl-CoA transferase|nr:CoA transferase [Nitrospinaceae bacterium]MBT3432623.1 CoA transferase [Nitrospinaceae bacterium]MBT4094283.1 CoA transferase [Nitrospinaceae bacterium]MBT4429850.1 CoA transferase [Nitrospinaceae bacterium]MBT5366820.1 CoA transferase [Nitrospinaceae bacterium]